MTKVGIFTYVKVDNVGSELQAFALVRKLAEMGFDAEVIDLFLKPRLSFPSLVEFVLRRLWRGVRRLKRILRGSATVQVPVRAAGQPISLLTVRKQRMEAFWNDTRHSAVQYSREDLTAGRLAYDAIVVGSDQVWNYRLNRNVDLFLLGFDTGKARRIAYATSLGVKRLPLLKRPLYRRCLRSFHALSVRESTSRSLVGRLAGKPVEHVVDPTLLLTTDEWARESRPAGVDGPYILLYTVRPNNIWDTLDYRWRKCAPLRHVVDKAMTFAGLMALPVVSASLRMGPDAAVYPRAVIDRCDAGPREFLSLIQHASLVVTNSFHTTVFAIQFRRNFLAMARSRCTMVSRFESLLGMLSLESHYIRDTDPVSSLPPEIDYDRVHALLAEKRAQSMEWLRRSLET